MSHKTGPNAIWLKRVLIPFWILQLLFMAIQIAGGAILIWYATNNSNSTTVDGNGNTVTVDGDTTTVTSSDGTVISTSTNTNYTVNATAVKSVAGVVLGIAGICFLFNVIEIIQYARRRMTAPFYFGFQLTKFLLWTVIFIIGLAGTVRRGSTIISFVANIVMELLFLGTLIYGSVIYHRHRKSLPRNMYPTPAYGDTETGYKHEQGHEMHGH